jgi:hypothetical protein
MSSKCDRGFGERLPMTADGRVRIAIVGLGFGAEFIAIYQRHPNAEMYAICRRNRRELDACGDRFGVQVRYTDFQQLLARRRRSSTTVTSSSQLGSP